MAKSNEGGYIEKFLKKADKALQEGVKKADKALQEGVKKADRVLDNAVDIGVMTAKQASKTSKEFRYKAKNESEALQKKGIKKLNEGITAAKNVTSNTDEDLDTLKKLGKLRANGVITEKEFQAKKKKILDRI
ncbi:MAG: SHOCT domain-containing protein [Nitrosopumilus sp.]